MALPSFVVIGVPKAGTTSLQRHMSRHPEVFAAWEPRFLHYAGLAINPGEEDRRKFRIKTLEAYEAIFAKHAGKKVLGDSSPSYLMYPEPSIAGIGKHVPDAKMIAVYRHPADRGYSDYVMQVSLGQEPCRQYRDAIRAEQEGRLRDSGQWRHYYRYGFYAEPTRKFLDAFPRERFLFLLYDDLVRNPAEYIRTVFKFLEVGTGFLPDMEERYKVGRWPKHFRLHHLLNSKAGPVRWTEKIVSRPVFSKIMRRVNVRNLGKPPKLDPELRRELTGRYREDILKLQDLIRRDLSGWLAQ
jgi:hypothetical protein